MYSTEMSSIIVLREKKNDSKTKNEDKSQSPNMQVQKVGEAVECEVRGLGEEETRECRQFVARAKNVALTDTSSSFCHGWKKRKQ